MEYIVLIAVFGFAYIVGYFLLRIRVKSIVKYVLNFLLLLVYGAVLVATGIGETSLLIYVILALFTVLGIVMRFVSPIVLNGVGYILAKVKKQQYNGLSYEEHMQSGHRMYFCVLSFAQLKVLLHVALIASFLKLI